jgi:thiol-disulfide isomerase/thioredoxin
MKRTTPIALLTISATFLGCESTQKTESIPATPIIPAEVEETTVAEAPLTPLAIGDLAPAISIDHWVKGDAIEGFENGQVYVMEFWATWCGPCITSMPHLSSLQDKYGDTVKIIGVSSEKELETVTNFLDETNKADDILNTDRMRYTVTVDPDGSTSRVFMEASGQRGIPTAFIINSDGKVAWIGHPMTMDEPLEQVVNGSWDLAAATETFAAEKAEERTKIELQKAYTEAVENDNWDMWNAAIDNFAAENGAAAAETFAAELAEKRAMDEMRPVYMAAVDNDEWDGWIAAIDTYTEEYGSNAQMNSMKFDALLTGKRDTEAAYAWARTMLAPSWDNASTLNAFAWNLLDRTPADLQDLDYALEVATRASELTNNEDAMILDTLARAYWELGEKYKAIAWQQKAATYADDQMSESIAATLKQYETSLVSVIND